MSDIITDRPSQYAVSCSHDRVSLLAKMLAESFLFLTHDGLVEIVSVNGGRWFSLQIDDAKLRYNQKQRIIGFILCFEMCVGRLDLSTI